MRVLITGGAGYIGSSVAWMFIDRGHEVTIIDNLKTGKKRNIPVKSKFINCDISNLNRLKKSLKENYDVVLHFAALINNQESIKKKKEYLDNNYNKSKIFLKFCHEKGIKNFIFSSSAAVYGSSKKSVHEKSKTNPLAPYGKSKLKFEKYLEKFKSEINYVILRYFNVVGVEKKMRCGFEIKKNKSLFNNLCSSALNKKNFKIFGNDFNTKDGTAVRDFIYISDLSEVHYSFAKILMKKSINSVFNCGYGKGYSVKEVIDTFNEILDKKISFKIGPRRVGDSKMIVANTSKFNNFFLWKPKFNNLKYILKTAYEWEKKIK